MITVEELIAVRDNAHDALEAQKPDVMFIGAFGEAEKFGYVRNSVEFNVFVTIFVAGLEHVSVDKQTGLISRIVIR